MIVVVLGRRGCGKSTHIAKRLDKLSRILIFDSLGEYSAHATPYTDLTRMIVALDERKNSVFRLAYMSIDDRDTERSFDLFCRSAWVAGNCTFVVDEVDMHTSATFVPEAFRKLVSYGRHRNVSIIAAARRAACVPRLLTSQADEIISFQQSEPNDALYLRSAVSTEFADAAARLPKYRYIAHSPWETKRRDRYISLDSREQPRYDVDTDKGAPDDGPSPPESGAPNGTEA